MKKIITFFLTCCTLHSFSQNVGIGTDSPTHSLHIVALVNPLRLEGLQAGDISDSVVTVDTAGVLRKRSGAFTVSLTGWSTTGNSRINTATNFIGTTDAKALLIRTNNQPSGLIDPSPSSRNNAYGNRSFTLGVTGSGNNGFGYTALGSLTSGSANTALGDSAAVGISTGNDNVALGSRALATAGTSIGNVAVGSNALRLNMASENIAIGKDAAAGNTGGGNILAIGTGALGSNKTTSTQFAIGNNALQLLNGGLENIAIGYNAGLSTTSASYNVLLGHYTLSSAGSSSRNTIVGHNAGLVYTGSGDNTFIGYQAGFTQTGGSGNTYIGSGVDIAGNPTVNNATGLGQSVVITASNQVRIGNTNITSIGGQVGWTTFSDARIKKNIQEDVPGLAFIEKLRPVTYNYDLATLQKIQGGKTGTDNTAFESIRFTGLLAQEVEAAATGIGYHFSGVDKPTNEQTAYGLRYAELVVPMIKAIQEMKQLIDKQQNEINELKLKLTLKQVAGSVQ
ncbi:MAG: tail fiber domain-containing protein [Chitinophagaceae bacterium]|nr:tail fiber domain-containing protein [Chitinophagaceae bacterium]